MENLWTKTDVLHKSHGEPISSTFDPLIVCISPQVFHTKAQVFHKVEACKLLHFFVFWREGGRDEFVWLSERMGSGCWVLGGRETGGWSRER